MFNTLRLQLRKIIIHHFHSSLSSLYKVDCSPYSALQRFVILSESLYTLPLTWDRKTWQPILAKRQALYGFIIASFISFVAASLIISSGIWEIIAFAKDPSVNNDTHSHRILHVWAIHFHLSHPLLVGVCGGPWLHSCWHLVPFRTKRYGVFEPLGFVSPVTLALAITRMARVTGN